MWYYEWNQQPFGPISKETLAEDLRSGKISGDTLVWREGMTEWKPLNQTELASLVGEKVPDNVPPLVPVAPVFYPGYSQPQKVKIETLSKLFWWWFCLTILGVPFYLTTQAFPGEIWSAGLVCGWELCTLASTVLMYVLLYQFWKVVQDGSQRTTPGQAVGFLFIPFFNFYWYLVAYFGLSKDLNRYIGQHLEGQISVEVRKSRPVLALLYVILLWAQLVLAGFVYADLFSNLRETLTNPAAISPVNSSLSLVMMIAFLIQTAVQILVFFDFFNTVKSIRAAEGDK